MADVTLVEGACLYHITLPMQVGFRHSVANRRHSDSVVLEISLDGITGIGECAPRYYVTGETSAVVIDACKAVDMGCLFRLLRSLDGQEFLARLRTGELEEEIGLRGGNNLACLFETALLDYLSHRENLNLHQILGSQEEQGGGDEAQSLPIAVSQVIDLGTNVGIFLAERGPFHFVKLKASDSINRDLWTAKAIRRALDDNIPMMIDANMSWRFDDALSNIKALRDVGVDIFEEPLPKGSLASLAKLRQQTGARIMLDESLCSLDDAQDIMAANACDLFNIRVAKCGGLFRSAGLIEFAREHSFAYQIGVQVAEVGPLIAASRYLAFHYRDQITLEAGQADRFFSEMTVSPAPRIDRTTNRVSPLAGPGFGMSLNSTARPFATTIYKKDGQGWQSISGC